MYRQESAAAAASPDKSGGNEGEPAPDCNTMGRVEQRIVKGGMAASGTTDYWQTVHRIDQRARGPGLLTRCHKYLHNTCTTPEHA
jgi:hypothetical protein